MVERELGQKFRALGGGLAVLGAAFGASCGGTPANDIPAPDTDLISVFYPVDGLVRGIGLAEAMTTKVDRVAIRAHPTTTESCAPVREDGSFEFSIVAVDNDVLEITGAVGERCESRGAPTFIRVPESPLPPVDFVCCHGPMGGTCQSIQRFEMMEACPAPGGVAKECTFDEECGSEEGEILELEPGQITVSPPDARGRVVVEGAVEYTNALVRVANLGLSPLGYASPGTRQATITNDKGQFRFESLAAAGDHELAIQVQDLNGFRSPPIGKRVPDAVLDGVDIIGVYAYEELGGGTPGPLAIHISPFGVDGRGMCPDGGAESDWICYTGGITHEMVTITEATIAATAEVPNLRETRTSTASPRFRYNTGVLGDVRSGPQDIVIVLDLSERATPTATDRQIQIEEVKRFIDRIRKRDRVGVVVMTDYTEGVRLTVNPMDGNDPGLRTVDGRAGLKSALDGFVADPEPKSISGGVEGLIIASQQMLRRAGSVNGKIVMILTKPPTYEDETGDDEQGAYDDRVASAFNGVLGEYGTAQPPYETHVVEYGMIRTEGDYGFIESVTDFSRGRAWQSPRSGADLEQTLTDVLQELSGAFILLYDVDVPCTGKSMTLNLSLELEVAGERRAADYSGPVRIARACGEQ